MTPAVNEFEHRERMRKAGAIADVLITHGADARSAESVRRDAKARNDAELLAKVRQPVSELTWNAVIDIIRGRDRTRAKGDGAFDAIDKGLGR